MTATTKSLGLCLTQASFRSAGQGLAMIKKASFLKMSPDSKPEILQNN